ncbi:MAG: fumarate reductase flavoprotein subunit [Pseudodesulfovibrio sp.]|uniref:succinate dehydrogenase n=1 Tax=Pseudodesulfovibrio aespoeensis (strain ATCC 700646 / DSM 10631 / Aspo-2) TaxID=643562 RepID=E6VRN6_PSEA9|nr:MULTISPECIES: fumarate reductase flavoprotein subunit [Pseudodesulfovibrio]MBU4193196.1 fumarate reductase flavoprotein subunit [Pseudomonadota bacterium]ADU63073.1 succinate dehydrogenase or fumarate reductase, flavoprotein subunit [Pseudodesulfovibrio aespoeensis Aspo-2]MBU4380189.1 fumarate reductase flavoprotein subunit [Pseudomonadota bacterium]MBU4474151.1 fumarate reductase flavoprotein subunit [Pseudomonadota bacterium]MBU4516781.1 fumarate reductase flavoprotein subunit [Pseudomona
MQTIYTDLLVVGAGLAGERAAVEAADAGFSAICLSLVPARRSHSSAAQGGMQASLGNSVMGEGDGPDVHFADTVKGSDWGCDQEVARLFADAAPIEMRRLAHWGVPWNRVVPGKSIYYKGGKQFEKVEKEDREGLIMARSFGGTAKWRTCYTSDGTGHAVMCTMDNRCAQMGVEVHDKTEAIALIHDRETCSGVVARCLRTGELRVYLARAVMIAAGGFGRIYPNTTNAVICDGGAHTMCVESGVVPLGNMEAVQFHPTGIVPTDILVTEGCRGDGGTLLDVNEKRFMDVYEPEKAELASRDVVSRWMTHHMREGHGVKSPYGEHLWLDIRHLGEEHITGKLREVYEICTSFLGVDPIHQLIPVRPTQHYSMGGVRTNRDGAAYGLKGLFSAGEAACWDMHGFNRLGGNSLAETVVAGGIVGRKIAEYLKGCETIFKTALINDAVSRQQARIDALVSCANGSENVYKVRAAMQDALNKGANIFRTQQGLEECVASLQDTLVRARNVGLRSDGKGVNPELAAALKLEGQVKLALMVAYGALMRTESRGSHNREDFQARNDRDWLTRTLAYWKKPDDTLPTLEYEPATIVVEIPPGDRGYGKSEIISADDKKE